MQFKIIISLFFIALTSCKVNLYRPLDNKVLNIREIELEYLYSPSNPADTILTLRKGDCQPNSLDYLIVIEKKDDETISKAYSNYGEYPESPTLGSFDWDIVFDSLEKIQNQKVRPAFHGFVIEGDTSWNKMGSISGSPYWVFNLCTPEGNTQWEFDYDLKFSNPSLTRVIVSDYIFKQTYNRLFDYNSIYGELKERKLPLIEKK